MKSKPSISRLKKKADAVFSLYIRHRDKGQCFTCGKKGDIKEMQCGHYVPRNHLFLRYDEINCNCQCVRCNVFLKGNYTEYAARLATRSGPGILTWLNAMKHHPAKFSRSDYENIIDTFQLKVNEIKGE